MWNMKKVQKVRKVLAGAVLAGVLGAMALAGCTQEMADTGATYNPGEPPLMTASHEGRYESLGATVASAATAAMTRWRRSFPPPHRCPRTTTWAGTCPPTRSTAPAPSASPAIPWPRSRSWKTRRWSSPHW